MPDNTLTPDEKERRRKKQFKRMGKILGQAWELDEKTNFFQDRPPEFQTGKDDGAVLCLTDIGQKIDNAAYRLGKHGWEDFAKDLGGVYNFHISSSRRSKSAPSAKKQLEIVKDLVGSKDKSLAKLASEHIPQEPAPTVVVKKNANERGKKRKAESSITSNKKKKHSNKNSELAEREERALEQLIAFVEEHGANRSLVSGFRTRVTKKASGKYDVIFYNKEERRFRSMREVGRFLKILNGSGGGAGASRVRRRKGFRRPSSREQEAEKKRLRKELEKLRKALNRTTKNFDDFVTGQNESRYPIDDRILMAERKEAASKNDDNTSPLSSLAKITQANCAAARIPDIDGFPGVPKPCTPDVLMSWDFLCTFERALALSPIALDDFASALVYNPPEGQIGDDVLTPPVYLVEAHLGLLKLLLQDKSSDDWWWSTLESDESEIQQEEEFDDAEDEEKSDDAGKPVIKMDMASAFAEVEDPLITTSWMRSLEEIAKHDTKDGALLKKAIKSALKFVGNKWVAAYLRKCLDLYKSQGMKVAKRAVSWLYETVLEARPDLGDRQVHKETVFKARAKVVETTTKQMEALSDTVPTVTDEEAVSDFEYEDDSDDESDEGMEDKEKNEQGENKDDSEKPASAIPPKPLPSLVDLLLPPAKPKHNSDFVDSFTWSHVVGATAARVLHRKKRVLNESDDSIRNANVLPPITVSERREREKLAASRILTECCNADEFPSPVETAIEHLCSGGNYLDLTAVQRLCLLRLLIEAAYDTRKVYEVVDGNYKQRTNAMKLLDQEQRKAKKEAKEKLAADEAAAREQLAAEVREKFLDEKREEIRKLNEKSKEFSDDVIESLTDEDILDFDEDFKADYEVLPGPESFNKTEVTKMVKRLQEEAAFDTDALRVLSLDELIQREKVELEEMEGQLSGFGGEKALDDPSLDRETARCIERLQRDIERARNQAGKLPELREKALEQLKDAIEDGTIKVLRNAFTAAKKAKLMGVDDETGGVWAVDLLRDAALELEYAKQNKRVLDAQRDLVAKRNKCFIRTEPLGRDRFGNRFWEFGKDEAGHIWAEAEMVPMDKSSDSVPTPPLGFLDLTADPKEISVGSKDMEADLVKSNEEQDVVDTFYKFSRKEYHSTGFSSALTNHSWGCHATEENLRAMIKNLDSKGIREKSLKTHLKESLEEIAGAGDKHETIEPTSAADEVNAADHEESEQRDIVRNSGDETVFSEAKEAIDPKDDVTHEICGKIASAIGATVRVRHLVEETKTSQTARYENGVVNGWKLHQEQVEDTIDDEDDEEYGDGGPTFKVIDVALWCVLTQRGHTFWLNAQELFESMVRHKKWTEGHGYFENDAAFFSYRNNLGRYCGKAAEAAYSSSPIYFAKLMMKRESELYPKLKVRSYDNSWGGQSGARALWTNSMKDYAYDFQTVRQGLLTLENAFFELTGMFSEYKDVNLDEEIDAKVLLNDPIARLDIELESIEKNLPGLWNTPASRAIYIEIVSGCKTTGFLGLALDLLVRNTIKFLQTHKLLGSRTSRGTSPTPSSYSNNTGRPTRSTRRMNAWQQQQQQEEEEDDEDWY